MINRSLPPGTNFQQGDQCDEAPPIFRSLDALAASIDRLASDVAQLIDKFEPAMVVSTPATADRSNGLSVAQSPITSRILGLEERIAQIRSRVTDALSRAEL